jgi:D-alanyl-D-alanine carboxypeptidase
MADVFRWRYEEGNPVVGEEVLTATVIEQGDCIWLDSDDIKPASDSTYAGGLATSQELFVDNFLGVAAQRSRAGDTDPVRCNTTGVHEFICASATFELGDLVGMDDNAAPDALVNQQVIAVTDVARAIGRVAKREAAATTSVFVRINSTVMNGGAQSGSSSA